MTLQEAYTIIEKLEKETTKKTEVKVYTQFRYVLEALENRVFTDDERHSIEMEIERLSLDSNPTKKHKFFRKALHAFEAYLQTTFSLTTKGYYARKAVALGSTLGLFIALIFLSDLDRSLGISLGFSAGILIGAVVGRRLDSRASAAGNVL